MKKLLLTSAATLLAVAAFAQGTVLFSNGGLNKVSIGEQGSLAATWVVMPAGSAMNFGLFYGVGATQPATLTFLSSTLGRPTSAAGVFGAADGTALAAVGIPGTQPGDANVWVKVAGWSSSFGTDWAAAQAAALTTPGDYFGQTGIVNALALGPSTGPGTPIWQTAAMTSPNKFAGGGFTLFTAVVPEPATMTLAGLGLAALMIFRRRK
jgi:hypothetical protein